MHDTHPGGGRKKREAGRQGRETNERTETGVVDSEETVMKRQAGDKNEERQEKASKRKRVDQAVQGDGEGQPAGGGTLVEGTGQHQGEIAVQQDLGAAYEGGLSKTPEKEQGSAPKTGQITEVNSKAENKKRKANLEDEKEKTVLRIWKE